MKNQRLSKTVKKVIKSPSRKQKSKNKEQRFYFSCEEILSRKFISVCRLFKKLFEFLQMWHPLLKLVLGQGYQKLWEVDLSTDELDGMNINPIRNKLKQLHFQPF